jgi:hypothetical protein
MWSEPFFAPGPITTDAAVFMQPPDQVIDAYLGAVSRPGPAASAQRQGLFRGRGRGPAPEFRMTMRPGTHGWEFSDGYYGLTAWVFVCRDRRSLLMISPWDQAEGGGWSFERSSEIFEPMKITLQHLGGQRIRREHSTIEEWGHQLQTLLPDCGLVPPAMLRAAGSRQA